MKFNPLTKEIYSDNGQFIKQLNCPFKIDWENLLLSQESNKRLCYRCNHEIIDSASLDDQTLIDLVKRHPDTCLKIDFNQSNIKISTNGFMESK